MKYFLMKMRAYLILILCVNLAMSANINAATTIQDKFAQLEKETGIRLGISVTNIANNRVIDYRAKERFPIQSTFKLILVASLLHKSMTDPNLLQQKIFYSKQDLVFWSPITENHLEHGMTILELCRAAMMYSDNTAANLLMKKIGGPETVTQFARSINDASFRVDHWETNLNSNPRDIHDTSTPLAMKKSLQNLLLGNVLGSQQKEQLTNWMKGNTTGDTRIRAGIPKGWIVADKTGAGDSYGISNDIGLIWPPNKTPIVITIYSVNNKKDAVRRDDIIVSVTKLIIEAFTKPNL